MYGLPVFSDELLKEVDSGKIILGGVSLWKGRPNITVMTVMKILEGLFQKTDLKVFTYFLDYFCQIRGYLNGSGEYQILKCFKNSYSHYKVKKCVSRVKIYIKMGEGQDV